MATPLWCGLEYQPLNSRGLIKLLQSQPFFKKIYFRKETIKNLKSKLRHFRILPIQCSEMPNLHDADAQYGHKASFYKQCKLHDWQCCKLLPTVPVKIVDKSQTNETFYSMKFSLSSVRLGLLEHSRATLLLAPY